MKTLHTYFSRNVLATIEELRSSVVCRRVAVLIFLRQSFDYAVSNYECNAISLPIKSKSKRPKKLVDILLENNKICFEPLPDQHEVFDNVRIPHYQGDVIIGMHMATKITVSNNASVLRQKNGEPLKLPDTSAVTHIFEKDMLPIMFFGVERTGAEIHQLYKKSRELYDFNRQNRQTRVRKERLHRQAFEGSYTSRMKGHLPLGYNFELPLLHVHPRMFLRKGDYVHVPFNTALSGNTLRIKSDPDTG